MGEEARATAQECIKRAKQHRSEDIQKSIRFLQKSLNIYKTEEAQRLLQEYEEEAGSSSGPQQPRQNSIPKASTEQPRRNSTSKPAGTPDQKNLASKIKGMKNFYDMLGVPKNASMDDIKKAYKKAAIKLHPDKNPSPEAEEAFKKVNAAYQCLSDEAKRRIYDQTGDDGSQPQAQFTSHFGEREDITPEDIFNMFFTQAGGRRHYSARRRFNRTSPESSGEGAGMFRSFLHFLPLIFLLVFSLLAAAPSGDDNPFSLEKTDYFGVSRKTPSGTQYFVSPNFQRIYGRDYRALAQVEAMVEKQLFKKLETECEQQRAEQRRQRKEAQKANAADPNTVHKAYSMDLPACEHLETIFEHA